MLPDTNTKARVNVAQGAGKIPYPASEITPGSHSKRSLYNAASLSVASKLTPLTQKMDSPLNLKWKQLLLNLLGAAMGDQTPEAMSHHTSLWLEARLTTPLSPPQDSRGGPSAFFLEASLPDKASPPRLPQSEQVTVTQGMPKDRRRPPLRYPHSPAMPSPPW